MPNYQIIYTPRVEDEVVVAEFSTLKEAELHMDKIKEERPGSPLLQQSQSILRKLF